MSETQTRAPAGAPVTALDRYRTVTAAGVTFHVDKYGWPVETCGRCGGSGEYSYCQRFGTTCFGCEGRGVALAAGKVSDIRAEYRAAFDEQARRVGYALAVGDEVRDWHAPAGTPFRWVADVTPTPRWCGKERVGSAPEVVHYFQLVTFDDGETRELGSELWRGRVTVRRAPYAEAAQAAMAVKVKRSRAAAARPPAPRKPRPARVNQFPGQCTACQAEVPAGAGTWSKASGVRHAEGGCTPAADAG